MTLRCRFALVIALLVTAVVNMTAIDGRLGHGAPFGQPTKSRLEVSQTRATLVRDTARRFKSAGARSTAAAAWLQIADSSVQQLCALVRRTTPRSASSFPQHWGSLHLNI